jgi:hypothetical protein
LMYKIDLRGAVEVKWILTLWKRQQDSVEACIY